MDNIKCESYDCLVLCHPRKIELGRQRTIPFGYIKKVTVLKCLCADLATRTENTQPVKPKVESSVCEISMFSGAKTCSANAQI